MSHVALLRLPITSGLGPHTDLEINELLLADPFSTSRPTRLSPQAVVRAQVSLLSKPNIPVLDDIAPLLRMGAP